ncbi:PTS transporter subunit EIIC [Enterococcus faecalis]|uniref:N-acetylglucosamine-specific PTS transporter subunit IIBC n=1 Tax=Enterococcus TaxID=1350 RepID=UPI0017828334|nr:N-acetylglucosamine-specific PTS transporter subunit IIBC [Enterococcus faecalis]EGO8211594.1 PTS transporter subunit EIIC [Enterococcus faecalis]EHV2680159.1 PTS transporter subunit EIIC [Enterococcus faecalis]MBD9772097.1 PTS transporter subunit EIIC [Enterococcus faecalis]MBD9790258.1 PTS transporter subunit EIIC [Enterococcus faecalis]MBD9796057.1 PTS transporter subunit EIIC [Enterococcus faecalis]
MKTYLQKLGRSIMLPVSILPVASLLVGIANWIAAKNVNTFTIFLSTAGMAILGALPILFAVGIAVGMSKDKSGAAGLSGLVGYLVVTKLLTPESVSALTGKILANVDPSFAKVENVFVGIICGLIAAEIYNRFNQVQLPTALAFFSGKRLIPILTAAAALVIAGILFIIWPIAYSALVSFGEAISKMGALGAGIYGFGNKMLIPTGLHHALNSVFWFDVIGINDIGNFLSGTGVKGVTGMYQAGYFPIMMFGLPAAGLAIYKNAKPERKKVTASLMLAAGFATFFTGVTEPMEFAFMFVAPSLYLVHAVLTGISMFIAASLHWTAGFAFSAGLVDYVLSLANPIANHPLMLILLGLVMGTIYFFVFDFMIRKFNLKTPGRGDEELDDDISTVESKDSKYTQLAKKIYTAIGEKSNIISIDNCITRLRLELKDTSLVDQETIKKLGVPGVKLIDKHSFQVIIGTDVQFVADEVTRLFQGKEGVSSQAIKSERGEFGGAIKGGTLDLYAPCTGELKPISEVRDDTFSQKMLGDGFAVEPTSQEITAPITGEVKSVFPTKHALTILADNGAEVLVHIGIDTVELGGEPFEIKVREGSRVSNGSLLAKVDFNKITLENKLTDVIVVITNKEQVKDFKIYKTNAISKNEIVGFVQL